MVPGYYFSMGFFVPFLITYNTLPVRFVYHIFVTMVIPVRNVLYLRECGGIMSLKEIWASTWIERMIGTTVREKK
jgi:hypothetical protein